MGLTILFYYYVAGVSAWAVMVAYRRWRPSDEPRNLFAVFEDEQPTSLKMRLANVVLVPLAIVFIFIPLWPLLISIELSFPWHKFKFWTDKASRSVPWTLTDEEAEFKVSKGDLLQRLNLAEIEATEQVFDPLQAVPDLPFGHLNKVWKAFVDGLEPGCELWSFRGRWKTQYRDWQMQGYVSLRDGSIGPHFLAAQTSEP